MLKLPLCMSATICLVASIFLSSTSVFAQDDESNLGNDPAAPETDTVGDPESDPSYELQPEPSSDDQPADASPQFPDDVPSADSTEPTGTAEPADQVASKSPWSLMREGSYTILTGIARLTPSGAMKDLVGSGTQFGLLVKYHMPVTSPFGVHYGLDLRMAKLEKDLGAPSGVTAKPSSRLRQSDVFAMAIGEYTFSQLFTAFVDFGLGVQYRALYIKAESTTLADDYFAGYGFGYVLRLGGKMDITKISNLLLVSRLYFGFEGGSNLESGKLKYNHKKVDINARQSLVGIDIGVQF